MVVSWGHGGLFRQIVAGTAASLGVLACSAVFAWVTPTLTVLLSPDSDIPMTPEEASWMVTMPEFGNIVSPMPAGMLADRFGRKVVILISAPIFLVGWIIIIYFKTLLALNIARVIQGTAVGIVYTVIPMYLGEIASAKHRGTVTSIFYCLWWFGFLLEYVLGSNLSFIRFTYASSFTSVIFFFAFLWQPESPYFYLMKRDTKKAHKSLCWLLNNSGEEVDEELERMKHCVEEDLEKKSVWNEVIATPTDRRALLILFLVGFLRQLNGIISLSLYSTQTLTDSGDSFFISPDNITTAMGVVLLFSSVCGLFTLDTFGRRPLLILSCLVSGVAMFCSGTFYLLKSRGVDVSHVAWIPPTSFLVLSGSSVAGIFPVNVAFASELFTSNTRGTASGVFSVYTTLIGVLVLKSYLTVYYRLGVYVNFYIFSASSLLGTILAYCFVPETKGKTFQQIRDNLENRK